jgi:hypothetical protein
MNETACATGGMPPSCHEPKALLEGRYFLTAGREFRFEKEYAKPASGTITESMPEKREAIRIS